MKLDKIWVTETKKCDSMLSKKRKISNKSHGKRKKRSWVKERYNGWRYGSGGRDGGGSCGGGLVWLIIWRDLNPHLSLAVGRRTEFLSSLLFRLTTAFPVLRHYSMQVACGWAEAVINKSHMGSGTRRVLPDALLRIFRWWTTQLQRSYFRPWWIDGLERRFEVWSDDLRLWWQKKMLFQAWEDWF